MPYLETGHFLWNGGSNDYWLVLWTVKHHGHDLLRIHTQYSVSRFAKSVICKIWVVLQQLSSQARLEQNSKKESILPNKCVRKVVDELNKSPYFQFADNTFCKTTDDSPYVKTPDLKLYRMLSTTLPKLFLCCFVLSAGLKW